MRRAGIVAIWFCLSAFWMGCRFEVSPAPAAVSFSTANKAVKEQSAPAAGAEVTVAALAEPGPEDLEAPPAAAAAAIDADALEPPSCEGHDASRAAPAKGSPDRTPRAGSSTTPLVTLTPGWATFGQVFRPGAVAGALQIGKLPTQTDVKTRWPDGSIRFAIVTAQIPSAGRYEITQGEPADGDFTPTVPEALVKLQIGEAAYTAALPKTASQDLWLSGPLVREQRFRVIPATASGQKHPFLSVIFDLRSYRDGEGRWDVTVENVSDKEGATQAVYAVDVSANGQKLFRQLVVTHHYLTRWRKVFPIGLRAAQLLPDFRPYYEAQALPRYLSSITNAGPFPVGPLFGILQPGSLNPNMEDYGGREDLAPYPDWTARALIHKQPQQLQYVLAHGNLAGSWPIHLREPEGSLVSIDRRPGFWLDGRADAGDRPAGDLSATGPLAPDLAHQPSLAYVPYLLTGDRYYADEMKFWANYNLLGSWQDAAYNARGGKQGLLKDNQVRGFAWALRNLSDAAAYLPDDDPLRGYFREKVENNLRWLDGYADRTNHPLGTLWEDKRPENEGATKVFIAPWEQNFLAWAIEHANQHGFADGWRARDKIARFQLSLFQSPEFPRDYACPYLLAVGDQSPTGDVKYYRSLAQVFKNTYFPGGLDKTDIPGWYGVDARLSLMIGITNGWPGAQAAYDWLHPQIAVRPHVDGIPDLCRRAGWAIALPPEK
jgi:hypothetical protein